jgi:CysZ protein
MALGTILTSFFAALAQITDARFARVFWLGIGAALGLLIAASFGVLWLLGSLFGTGLILPIVGEVSWLGDALSWAGFLVMMGLSVFLMVPVASAMTSIFLDSVADAVEARHYPALPPATPVPFATALRDSVNFLGVLVGANVLALLLYVFLPFAALLIFWGLNGYLLGREYATLVAMRRGGRAEARAFWARHKGTLWAAGILMALPLSLPLVNLTIPILGVATFTHLYHRLR